MKRTRKLLGALRDNLAPLFDCYGERATFRVLPLPNERPGELWIRSADGKLGFRLSISEGRYGLTLTARAFDGLFTVSSDSPDDPAGWIPRREVNATIYRVTPEACAFRRWYHKEETEEDVALLRPEYRRTGRAKDVR